MSDIEDDTRPRALSLQALLAPVVAVLLILAGVVISVLITGTSLQNEAEIARSQQMIDSAFRAVGRDLGQLAAMVARSRNAEAHLDEEFDNDWAAENLTDLRGGFGDVEALVLDRNDLVIYRSEDLAEAEVSPTIKGIVDDVRRQGGESKEWTSAFVKYGGRLHVAAASVVERSDSERTSAPVLVAIQPVDQALLDRLSEEFLIEDIKVHPATDIQGSVGIVIRSPAGENVAAISWAPAQPGDKLFDYLLVPILVASLIAALLLATFLRTAFRAAQQLKRGAAALAESGELLEYNESILSAIVHGVADGIITVDDAGLITSANASVKRIFGYEPEEVLGQPADMLLAGQKRGNEADAVTLIADPDVEGSEYRECTGRRKDGGRFVLDLAISHITYQSRATIIAIMRDITERKQAEETLNLLSTGMALVDRDCRLLMANRTASRLLDSADGLRLSHGRITAARREQIDGLRDLVYAVCTGNGATDDEGAGVMTIDRGDSVRPLSIKVAPVQLDPGDEGSRVAAIFIRDPEIRQSVPPEVVAKLFGLTFAEARVVVELVKGNRPQEVADELGVSLNTVRNQLKQIFSKTNTGRQSELISLVLSSAAFVSEHGLEVEVREGDEDEDVDIRLTGS